MRLYHQSIGDLKDIIENVAYISSPLISENKHSEVLANERNCKIRKKGNNNKYSVTMY